MASRDMKIMLKSLRQNEFGSVALKCATKNEVFPVPQRHFSQSLTSLLLPFLP